MPDPVIAISVNSPKWNTALPDPAAFFQPPVVQALKAGNTGMIDMKTPVEISILLTNDREIQALNREYRHKDKATNVLSFPQFDIIPGEKCDMVTTGLPVIPLGDIIFGYETIQHEAQVQNKTPDAHLAHLTVHGVLHLLGYDHIEDDDAQIMESLERRILHTLGHADPYVETGVAETPEMTE